MKKRLKNYAVFAFIVANMMIGQTVADDLLDPSQLGAVKKATKEEGLLDPSDLGNKNKSSKSFYSETTEINRVDPLKGRNMADSVVVSLDGLTKSANDLINKLEETKQTEHELSSRLQDLILQRELKLDEYRRGEFCSGCGKTKSEILSKGDTFPHPGQHTIRATQQQIDAKDRELQGPIDQLQRKLNALRKEREDLINRKAEALLQIGYGVELWRTAVTFERLAILSNNNKLERLHKAESKKAQEQINKLGIEILAPKANKVKLKNDMDFWKDTLAKLNSKNKSDQRKTTNEITSADSTKATEHTQIQGYLTRGALNKEITFAVSSSYASQNSGFNALGGLYRMGDYSPKNHDEALDNVSKFLVAFNQIN